MKNSILILSLFIVISGCAIPLMEIDHIAQIGDTYSTKGSLKVNQFEDKRSREETAYNQIAVNKITPQIWSGSTNPEMMIFFQQALKEEARNTKMFFIDENAEFELSGYVTSMKVDRKVTILRYILPIFDMPKLTATVRFHANLKKNGVTVLEKDIRHIEEESYWAMIEFGWKMISNKASILLDKAITKSIKQLFDEIETFLK